MSNKIPVTQIYSPSDKKGRGGTHRSNKIDTQSAIATDIYRGKIYTKRVRGYFQKLRRQMSFILLGVFAIIPWLDMGNRPAVLFDLQEQKFHVFSMTFWPQDAVFLVSLLLLACFLLIAATLVIGRAWCGFTCPQTVWTFLFMWVEDKCEGDRNQRIKADKQAWNQSKIIGKFSKHFLWMIISLLTAYTFVGYFYPIKELVVDTVNFNMHYLGAFWLLFFTLGTYLNAGWLREKVCMHMCPYARFQAVMYSEDTLVVTYDEQRGENRGQRKKNQQDNTQLGDCVDCSLCVQVCPVDIDIRDGLQYPCIDCGLCADACDNVMEKMGFEKGLISFASQNDPKRVTKLRHTPKALVIAALSVMACAVFLYFVLIRSALTIDVIRDRNGALYQHTAQGIENVYTVKINNKSAVHNTFVLETDSQSKFKIVSNPVVIVNTGEVDTLMVRVAVQEEDIESSNNRFNFVIKERQSADVLAKQETRFIAPL